MTSAVPRVNVGGVWTRWAHTDVDTGSVTPPAVYDWTVNPYGTAYDADGRLGGGYIPDATHSGVPAGTTFSQTITGSGGYYTITTGTARLGDLHFDRVDFACHMKLSSGATGYVLCTRGRHRGPAVAIDPATSSAAQGLCFNLSAATIVHADCDFIPDAPVNKLDAVYGKNIRLYRCHWKNVIDGVGSQGNVELWGCFGEKASYIYPDTVDGHSDGTHNDLAMQVFGNDHHVIRGCHIEGLVDPAYSSTTDATNHPIPTTTNSTIQINHTTGSAPTGLDVQYNLLGGGGYAVNIAGRETLPNLGAVKNNRFKRNNKYASVSAICAPAPNSSGVVIHCDIPTSGAAVNKWDDNSATITPYVDTVRGSSLVWP